MKRMTALLLMLILCLGLVPGMAEEETVPGPEGDWYAEWKDVTMQLTLQPDGAYSLRVPGEEKAVSGAWKEEDGFVSLSGDMETILSYDEAVLRQESLNLFFYREKPEVYVPADVKADADVSDYEGCWGTRYVMIGNAVLPAKLAGQDVRMLIEKESAAIVGTGFDRKVIPMAFENGALTAQSEGRSITLQMQKDYSLRMTVTEEGKTTVMILTYFLPESLFPDTGVEGE